MKNIMNKVTQWFQLNFSSSNASAIRQYFAGRSSVKRRLQRISGLLITCMVITALFCTDLYPTVWNDFSRFQQYIVRLIIVLCGGTGAWLYGYRIAVAKSQADRENYLNNTKKMFRKLNKGFLNLILVLIAIAAALSTAAVAITVLVKLGKLDYALELFPSLEGIADSVLAVVNRTLEGLLALLR